VNAGRERVIDHQLRGDIQVLAEQGESSSVSAIVGGSFRSTPVSSARGSRRGRRRLSESADAAPVGK